MSLYYNLSERKDQRRRASLQPRRERRRGPDLWTHIPVAVGAVAWTTTLIALMFVDRARPRSFALDRFFHVQRSSLVSPALLEVAAWLLLATLLLCSAGLYAKSFRMKRKGDRYPRSLIVLALASALALLGYGAWLL